MLVTTPPSAAVTRSPWWVLAATSVGVVLTFVNTSSLDVALPAVVRHFHAGPTAAAWVLLAYMLVITVLVLGFGRLADLVGRRRLYLAGLTTLTLASLGCAVSPTVEVLIAMRVLQAVGAASVVTNTSAILADAFPPHTLSTALGLNASVAAAGSVVGPALGGGLVLLGGWSAVFWACVPLGAVALVASVLTVRRDPVPVRDAAREPFDVAGATLSFVGLGGVVLALSFGGPRGWTDPLVVASAVAGVAGLVAFTVVQGKRDHPLVDPALVRDRARGMAYLAAFLMAIANFSVVLAVSLYFQAAAGLDAFAAGLRVVPTAVATMVAAAVAGRLSRRWPARTLSTLGMLGIAAGLGLLAAVLHGDAAYPPVAAGLTLVGLGVGLFMTPNTSAILSSVAPERRGIANGVRSMVQQAGFVLSTALTLAVVTAWLDPDSRRAAYAGTLSSLPGAGQADFLTGTRAALLVLLVLSLAGAAASMLRGTAPAPAARRPSDDPFDDQEVTQ